MWSESTFTKAGACWVFGALFQLSESPWETGTTGLPTAGLRKSRGSGKLRVYMSQSDFKTYVPNLDPSEINGPQAWNCWEEAANPRL